MKFNEFETKIMDNISKNPGITTRNLLKLCKMGNTTFYTYSRILLEKQIIIFDEVGNTQKWYVKTSDLPDFVKTKRLFQYEVKKIQKTITKNFKIVNGRHHSQILGVYEASVVALLSFIETIELIEIRTKPNKPKLPNYIKQGKTDLKKFLAKIINDMPPLRYELSVKTMLGRYHFNIKNLETYEKTVKLLDKKSDFPKKLKSL